MNAKKERRIKLREIFNFNGKERISSKEELYTLSLNSTFIADIASQLNLTFESNKAKTNLCLANSNEVRPEFRTTFSKKDLIDYIYALLTNPINFHLEEVPFPKDAIGFWSIIASG